jgi:hypothetical protein
VRRRDVDPFSDDRRSHHGAPNPTSPPPFESWYHPLAQLHQSLA